MPDEIIYLEDQLVNEMYFIEEGIINLKKKVKNENMEHIGDEEFILTKGDHFGEMAILTHWRSDFVVKACVFCIVQTFSRKNFLELKE